MENIVIHTAAEDVGERIDKFISTNADGISRSYASKLIEDGNVSINGKAVAKNYKIKGTETIEILLPEPVGLDIVPQNIPLDIVYEDNDLIVINKPQGMVVHPAAGNYDGTLVNALLYHCGDNLSAINGVVRPGIVHRLDKDTSGLLVVAKNNDAHLKLAEQLKERKAVRRYNAVLNGNIKNDSVTVNAPIGRHPTDRKKMCVSDRNAREAVTHINVLKRYGRYTLAECVLETGRTHQIRVHTAYIGHSVVGDPVYGIKKEAIKTAGQLLHARTIGFKHPRTGEYMEFTSDLPDYFKNALEKIEKICF